MCTAVSFNAKYHYFGRNLDYEHDFGQKVVVTPRNYKFNFINGDVINSHYAIIGMALVASNYPLYFDATNEMGLSIAGLNFPGNAHYFGCDNKKYNIASFEVIPLLLSKCKNIAEVKSFLCDINITNDAFSDSLNPTPLHWIISDKSKTITVEQTSDGLKVFDNPVGVLTNNPAFDYHMTNLSNYMNVTSGEPQNNISSKIHLEPYSRGMGAIGIPGDLSSASRFVKAVFTKLNSVSPDTEFESVNQFFHILYSVYQQKGCVKVGSSYEITNYTSCCNTDKCVYYYTTYNNFTINSVDMFKFNLESDLLYENDLIK